MFRRSINYYAKYLEGVYDIIEDDSFDLSFQIFDSQNNQLESSDLSDYKFNAEFTDQANEITKQDVNFSGGSDSEIEVDGDTVIIHFTEDETSDFTECYFDLELKMTHKTTGNKYTVFCDMFFLHDTATD